MKLGYYLFFLGIGQSFKLLALHNGIAQRRALIARPLKRFVGLPLFILNGCPYCQKVVFE